MAISRNFTRYCGNSPEYISLFYGVHYEAVEWQAFDASGSRYRHIDAIRSHFGTLSVMNNSEGCNRFVQWSAFGGQGMIAENNRDEQRKPIKYNHLVANCLTFHNVQGDDEGASLSEEGRAGAKG